MSRFGNVMVYFSFLFLKMHLMHMHLMQMNLMQMADCKD